MLLSQPRTSWDLGILGNISPYIEITLSVWVWSWESKGTHPPCPPRPPKNKALLRDYWAPLSLNQASLGRWGMALGRHPSFLMPDSPRIGINKAAYGNGHRWRSQQVDDLPQNQQIGANYMIYNRYMHVYMYILKPLFIFNYMTNRYK